MVEKMRASLFTSVILLILCLFGLTQVKLQVQKLCDEVLTLEVKEKSLYEQIKVLNAEWSYLNRADRLEKLASKYLQLSKVEKFESVKQNKLSLASSAKNVNENDIKNMAFIEKPKVRWRVKSRDAILAKIGRK